MKKLFLLAGIVTATTFASCKKDYTCQCTTTSTSGGTTATYTEDVATYKATHKSADKSCQDNNTSYRTCNLK